MGYRQDKLEKQIVHHLILPTPNKFWGSMLAWLLWVSSQTLAAARGDAFSSIA